MGRGIGGKGKGGSTGKEGESLLERGGFTEKEGKGLLRRKRRACWKERGGLTLREGESKQERKGRAYSPTAYTKNRFHQSHAARDENNDLLTLT